MDKHIDVREFLQAIFMEPDPRVKKCAGVTTPVLTGDEGAGRVCTPGLS